MYIRKIKPGETRGDVFSVLRGMTSLASNSKFCNFITSLKLIKTTQNFVKGSFFVKLI